jgi:5-methylcytosine-specific restriction endonuclease McrA
VWAQLAPDNSHVVRIFKSEKAAFSVVDITPIYMPRNLAVASIRHQIFLRSKGCCEECGSIITENSMEMHEREWRGKGGEISLENSIAACKRSHKFAHRKRAPQFTRRQQP